jgi:hypothetical protein
MPDTTPPAETITPHLIEATRSGYVSLTRTPEGRWELARYVDLFDDHLILGTYHRHPWAMLHFLRATALSVSTWPWPCPACTGDGWAIRITDGTPVIEACDSCEGMGQVNDHGLAAASRRLRHGERSRRRAGRAGVSVMPVRGCSQGRGGGGRRAE